MWCVTPRTTPDYELLADAVAILGQLGKYIWQVVETDVNKRKIVLLSTKIQQDSSKEPCNSNGNGSTTNAIPAKDANNKSEGKKKRKSKTLTDDDLDDDDNDEEDVDDDDDEDEDVDDDGDEEEEEDGSASTGEPANNPAQNPGIILPPFELYAPGRKLVRQGGLLIMKKDKSPSYVEAGTTDITDVGSSGNASFPSASDSSSSKTPAKQKRTTSRRHVFLFNDICVMVQVTSAHSSKFDEGFFLKGAKVHSKQISLASSILLNYLCNIKVILL